MSTTTPDEGAANAAQPEEPAAVTDGHNADQIITTDESGTPTLEPVASQVQSEEQAATEEEKPAEESVEEKQPEAQAETDDEIVAWAEKKGLKINPENPNEVKLARMQLETDRKFHETRQVRSAVQPPELLEESGDSAFNEVIQRQNETELKLYVRDWFDANPAAKEVRTELQQIANQRPWLSNMDDVYAHYLANPSRADELKREGGKQALTNLAQKQSQVPPSSGATNSGVYNSTSQITPQNVYEQVDSHDQAWFEKNHKAISDAMAGKMPTNN